MIMTELFISIVPIYFAMRYNFHWSFHMRRFSYHVPMDPQVCPPPLCSSQSMISSLERSPASTFKPGHSRSNSTGSIKHSRQVRMFWLFSFYFCVLPILSAKGVKCNFTLFSDFTQPCAWDDLKTLVWFVVQISKYRLLSIQMLAS